MFLGSRIDVCELCGAFGMAAWKFLKLLMGGGACGLGTWLALLRMLKLRLRHCALFPENHLAVQLIKMEDLCRHISVSNSWMLF